MCSFTNVPRYKGVDSSLDWLMRVSLTAPAHYKFSWAEDWGKPTDNSASSVHWPFYRISPLASETKSFDFYFIDGRFRVACVAAAFLHASFRGKKNRSFLVGLHDFSKRNSRSRHSYGVILSIAKIVDGYNPEDPSTHATKIVILQREDGVSDKHILEIWKTYRSIFVIISQLSRIQNTKREYLVHRARQMQLIS
jgi:hypothetical protein